MKYIGKLKEIKKKVPKWAYNKYFVTAAFLGLYILIFDQNNFIAVAKWRMKLHDIRDEKRYYQNKSTEVKQQLEELKGNKQMFEKFAREKYLMKKENEEIFIIVDPEKENLIQD